MEFLPIVLVVAVVLGIAAIGALQAKKRREALAAWATERGLAFSKEKDKDYKHLFPDFKRLKTGDSDQYAFNISSGLHHGRPLRAFDYHYVTISTSSKGGTRRQHHHFSAIILESTIPLKPLHIRPEGFLDKIGAAFGFEDINFESAEFSRKYKVSAPDRKWAYDVFHVRAIDYLLALPSFSMEFGNGNQVMFWTKGTWLPDQFDVAIASVEGLLETLPHYLIE